MSQLKKIPRRDKIEMNYSEQKIREMYAKLLAGRGRSCPIDTVPTKYIQQAAVAPYEAVIIPLVEKWPVFNGLVHLKEVA